MGVKYTVKNCHNCPLCNNDNEHGTTCNHPRSDLEQYELTEYGSQILPVKCPLKNEMLTLKTTCNESKTTC